LLIRHSGKRIQSKETKNSNRTEKKAPPQIDYRRRKEYVIDGRSRGSSTVLFGENQEWGRTQDQRTN
jgi:hypothetical protein